MKTCPECGANVEGLIYRCDCCGALLDAKDRKSRLFSSLVRQTPACMNFANIFSDFLEQLEPETMEPYASFLERVEFDVFCFRSVSGKSLENRVAYYPSRKQAIIRVVYENRDVVYADAEEKKNLAGQAILQSLSILNERVKKHHHTLDGLVAAAEAVLLEKGNAYP